MRIRIYTQDIIQQRAIREVWRDVRRFTKQSHDIDPDDASHKTLLDICDKAIGGLSCVINRVKNPKSAHRQVDAGQE